MLLSPPDEIRRRIIDQQDERDDVSRKNRPSRFDPVERGGVLIDENEIRVQSPGGLHGGDRITRHGEHPMAESLKLRREAPRDEVLLLRDQDTEWPQGSSL